jgi:tRNA(adenine34) deaminase
MNDDIVAQHQRFMMLALEQASVAASLGEVPVGAVIVKEGVVIASGHNRRELDNDPTAHAELLAIREAARALGDWRLTGCTLYVTLEPCSMCAGSLVLARIDKCVFGCTDPKGGYCGTVGDLSKVSALNHHYDVVQGVLAEACSEQLKNFFKTLRKRRKKPV